MQKVRKRLTDPPRKVELMLDSGAFTAWTRGAELDVHDYIQFIQRNEHLLNSYINMDVIPGRFGQKKTQKDVEESAARSYENQQIMKAAGLKPMAVFHQNERMYWLERMLLDGEEYIGINTRKDSSGRDVRDYLDTVFSLLTDKSGRPLVKAHGLGITKPEFLLRYPWYSVDSSAWALQAGYGKMLVPVFENGKFNYLRPPLHIQISGEEVRSGQSNQFELLGPTIQDYIRRFVTDECGLDMTEVRYNIFAVRRQAMLIYYNKLCEAVHGMIYKGPRNALFSFRTKDLSHLEPTDLFNLHVFHVTQYQDHLNHALCAAGVKTRLMSYHVLREYGDEALQTFIRTGYFRGVEWKPRNPGGNRWDSEHLNYKRWALLQRVRMYDEKQRSGEET